MNVLGHLHGLLGSVSKVAGLALSQSLLAATPTAALNDTSMLFTGTYFYGGADGNYYMVLGTSIAFNENTPAAGLGEQAAQVRMRAGTLSTLRVNVVTATAPTGGTLKVIVRKNGKNTILNCEVTGTGFCGKNGNVSLSNSSLVTVKLIDTLADSGTVTITYTLVYD